MTPPRLGVETRSVSPGDYAPVLCWAGIRCRAIYGSETVPIVPLSSSARSGSRRS